MTRIFKLIAHANPKKLSVVLRVLTEAVFNIFELILLTVFILPINRKEVPNSIFGTFDVCSFSAMTVNIIDANMEVKHILQIVHKILSDILSNKTIWGKGDILLF